MSGRLALILSMTTTMLSWVSTFLTLLLIAEPILGSPLPGAAKAAARDDNPYRIPTNVAPDNYRLFVRPQYPETDLVDIKKFDGELVIDATIQGTVANKIVLHKAVTILEIQVLCILKVTQDDEESEVTDVYYDASTSSFCDGEGELLEMVDREEDEEKETYTINMRNSIAVGEHVRIVLTYEAEFPEGGLAGFYVSTYEKVGGKAAAMLTTKFEPTHARKAFPCFDEPALKATFDLIVEYRNGLGVISNMEQTYRNEINRTVAFERTPKMSTYLLVFIVYEEESFGVTDEILRPLEMVPYRTWGRKSMINERTKGGRLSQVEGPAALDFLNRYTGIDYNATMTKMDMAAIPDFQSGAMENWALVTYRENSLLYDDQTGTTTNYKRVVDVIAHELVHMWFGNLVTTAWWDSIWLNEGFARYFQYLVAHERYPNWHMLERFVLDEQMGVMGSDASVNSAPLTDPSVWSPEQIGNHFSTISYSKGGAILRQIRNAMGEVHFQKGIREYLAARQLNSATPEQLFDHLVANNNDTHTKVNAATLRSALQTWTTKGGYPLITVQRDGNTFNVTQERFLLVSAEDSTLYPVPLTYYTSKDASPVETPLAPQRWMNGNEKAISFTIEDLEDKNWVLFNAYQGGYYRVNYDEATWEHLGWALDRESADGSHLDAVAPLDRAALVDNALALARAGALSYERAFRLLRFLRHDTAFEPWAAARTALAHVQRMIGQEQPFQDFIAYIVEKAYDAAGFAVGPMDAHIEKVHRTNVLTLACSAGYPPCLREARKQLLQHLSPLPIGVHPELQSVVFCYGLKNDTGTLWNQLWKKYAKADAAERSTLINALGCINHRDTLKTFLDKSVNGEVRSQDAYSVFSSVAANPDGYDVALDFLTFWGYEKLEDNYGAVRNAMSTVLNALANRLTTSAEKKQLEIAVEEYKIRHQGAINTVESNMAWLEKHDASVLKHLEEAKSYLFSDPNGAPATALAASLLLLCVAVVALLR